MPEPTYAAASVRNSEPILGVLRSELVGCRSLLEIGSGTGQHAVRFAAEFPELLWQTSDLDENHGWIHDHIENAGLDNVLTPLSLDVSKAHDFDREFDAVYSCNTMHIMSYAAVKDMVPMVASVLVAGGMFCYYGPFTRAGQFNTPSNAAFDESLRARGADMGLRDLDDVNSLASQNGLRHLRTYAMPSNNLLLVWRKSA